VAPDHRLWSVLGEGDLNTAVLRLAHTLKSEGIDGLIAALNRKADILIATTAEAF
jgi:hypothetical protein